MMANNKILLDTNAVLRFITGDNAEKSQKVSELISDNECVVPIEVIAEVVFNLENFYKHPRELIAEEIKEFSAIKENLVNEEILIRFGCNIFSSTKLDFIDSLLIAYANVKKIPVFSYDTELNKILGQNAVNQ